MAEEFKEYSSSDTGTFFEGLRSKFTGFNVKELALLGATIALVVMVIVLGAFVGVEKKRATTAEAQVAELQAVCQDKMCLEAAAWSMAVVNNSVAPCDNFYQYACGNYKLVKPLDSKVSYHSVLHDMYERNEDKLVYLLETPVQNQDWASEKKLKDMFMSCNDQFGREKVKGKPLVDLINQKLKGWSVFGNWDSNQWDFNVDIKVAQDDLWSDPFWIYYIIYDWDNRGKYTLGLYPSGTGRYLRWNYYINPQTQKVRDDYQKFMRRVAGYLQRDAEVTMSDADKASAVDQFVSDAFGIEMKVAQIASTSSYLPMATAPENRITLQDLKTQTGNVIDFVEIATYMFEGNVVTGDTPVVVYNLNYLKSLMQMVSQLPASDKPRMLHNYIVWRVVETYTQDLSMDYLQANVEVSTDVRGYTEFPGLWRYCFNYVSREMKEALGALYIMDHFADRNKDKVMEITEKLKLALEDSITNSPWMDSATKDKAMSKAKAATYKLGYPDDLVNQTAVDLIYNTLTVDRSNYFANVIAINEFKDNYFTRMLVNGEDRNDWYFSTFDTNMAILWYWNEIIVPAGFFQFPLYDYTLPHYMTFGGLGSITGHFITHVVDEYGRNWDEAGMNVADNNWWSNATRDAYTSVRQCIVDFYTNKTQGPYTSPNGNQTWYPIDAQRTAQESIAKMSGVRLAYKGFKTWEQQYGEEKQAPGLGLTNHQMFFLSYAQSFCSNRMETSLRSNAMYGSLNDETDINTVLQELEEFSAAFSCPVGSPMNPAQKCQLY